MGIEPAQSFSPVRSPDSAPSPEEVRSCLERVLQSSEFSGSPQLSRFLRYIVDHALAGEPQKLKESTIGVTVFQRGTGYDPKADPIVRVEARRLRSRLESYNRSTGVHDPVWIDLPRGGYLPSFIHPPVATGESGNGHVRPPADKRYRWRRWGLVLAVVALAVVTGVLVRRAMAPDVTTMFWRSLFDGSQPALVIPADSGLVVLEGWTRKGVSLEEYTSKAFLNDPRIDQGLGYMARARYTSIADLEMAIGLARRAETGRRGFETRYPRDVRPGDVKSRNVILIGSRHSNPWLELFESSSTFHIEHDEQTRDFRLINTAPLAGEPRDVVVSREHVRREAYAIICYHHKDDGPTHVLIVAGMTAAGTEAGADFVLNDEAMRPWLERAREQGAIRGFDLLLRTTNLDGRGQQSQVAAFHLGK